MFLLTLLFSLMFLLVSTVLADVPGSATVPELPATTTVHADTTVLATITSDTIIADVPSIAIISHSNYGSRDFICHVLSLLGGVSKLFWKS